MIRHEDGVSADLCIRGREYVDLQGTRVCTVYIKGGTAFSLEAGFWDIILESESKSFIQAVEQKERDLSALVKLLMKLSTFLISLGHGD